MSNVRLMLSDTDEERIFDDDGSSATFSLQKDSSVSTVALLSEETRVINQLWTGLLLSFGFIIPILSMLQCPTWDDEIESVRRCVVINTQLSRSYASAYYFLAIMFIRSFGLLLIAYLGILWIANKLGRFVIRKLFSRGARIPGITMQSTAESSVSIAIPDVK